MSAGQTVPGSLGPEFVEKVTQAFQALVAQGRLTTVSSFYDPVAFGNAVVEFKGKYARLRVTRDRAEHFIQVAVPGRHTENRWCDLEYVLRAAGIPDFPSVSLQVTPAEAARIVEKRLAALEDGLSPAQIAQTKGKLDKLYEEKWK